MRNDIHAALKSGSARHRLELANNREELRAADKFSQLDRDRVNFLTALVALGGRLPAEPFTNTLSALRNCRDLLSARRNVAPIIGRRWTTLRALRVCVRIIRARRERWFKKSPYQNESATKARMTRMSVRHQKSRVKSAQPRQKPRLRTKTLIQRDDSSSHATRPLDDRRNAVGTIYGVVVTASGRLINVQ